MPATFPNLQSLALSLVVAFAVGGCSSVTPPAPAVSPPATDQPAAARTVLDVERQWLQSWFKGTPVLIGQRNDGALTVDVPQEFCFDAGRSSVKPALGAVLDKVAESLRRRPSARLTLIAASGDTAPLALRRAAEVHKHLLSRGVPAARIGKPTSTAAAAVQLRMESDSH